jgi:hypothetical protein
MKCVCLREPEKAAAMRKKQHCASGDDIKFCKYETYKVCHFPIFKSGDYFHFGISFSVKKHFNFNPTSVCPVPQMWADVSQNSMSVHTNQGQEKQVLLR